MRPLLLIRAFLYRSMLWLCSILMRFVQSPQPPAMVGRDDWVYALGRRSWADRLAADVFLRQQQRPGLRERPIIHAVSDHSEPDLQLVEQVTACLQGEASVQWVPISVLWGHTAEQRRWGALFADRWASMGPLRTLWMVLFNLRHIQVLVSKPIRLPADAPASDDAHVLSRKIQRVLRIHFVRLRQRALGPDLSHRRLLMRHILKSPAVQNMIAHQARAQRTSPARMTQRAQKLLNTMMADVSAPTIHFMDRLLGWLWQRIYGGIELGSLAHLETIPADHTRVYVPCHRSHVDYLLLSYCLYQQGINLPHIAAGINLNIPIVGALLRRSGAFFMRRSLGGDKLYTTLFNEYLYQMINRGYALEYFVEGGRSRTGRMLSPKLGMLTMTVRSFLRSQLVGRQQPVQLIPVYIGYEKIFEENSYLKELRGQQKQKESLWGLLGTVRRLRNYGTVSVNFGTPIDLSEHLTEHQPDWKVLLHAQDSDRPAASVVQALGQAVVQGINACAALNPINLLALALLTHPRHALDQQTLLAQLTLYQSLQQRVPASSELTLPKGTPQAWIDHAVALSIVQMEQQPLGTLYRLGEDQAIAMTYYRNNIIHLWVLPSLICNVLMLDPLPKTRTSILSIVLQLDAFVCDELMIKGSTEDRKRLAEQYLDALTDLGLVNAHDQQYRPQHDIQGFFNGLRRLLLPTLERYYLTLFVLTDHGSEQLSPQGLETRARELAQRMAILHGLNSPEFFDGELIRRFIHNLRTQNFLTLNQANTLEFNASIKEILAAAETIMDPDLVRQVKLCRSLWKTQSTASGEAAKAATVMLESALIKDDGLPESRR